MKVLDSIENKNKIQEIVSQRTIKKYSYSGDNKPIKIIEQEDYISPESPLEIAVKTNKSSKPFKNIAITMCTLQAQEALAIGFLFTEGIIQSKENIININTSESRVEIILNKSLEASLDKINRNFYTSSSCGICSKSNVDSIKADSIYLPWTSQLEIHSHTLFNLRRFFKSNQEIFDNTGGIHSTILINSKLEQIVSFEDIGRHNSMDKVIGYALMNDLLPLDDHVMLVSGRLSFELVQKSIMAGIPIIGALGAPSDLAITEAENQNVTVIGFAKDKSYNVYSGFERIINTNE